MLLYALQLLFLKISVSIYGFLFVEGSKLHKIQIC